MQQHQNQMLLTTATAVPEAPGQPASDARGKICPTRFRVECSTLPKNLPSELLSVDSEYRKYTSYEINPKTEILSFWEVRFLSLKGTLTHLLNRSIRMYSQLCLQWLWTSFLSRQHLCHANMSFLQRRTQTPPNETR